MLVADTRPLFLEGDVIARARELPSESVHCIITSPPYWGLRKYHVPRSLWPAKKDLSPTCNPHQWSPDNDGRFCALCDAWEGEMGREPTLALYLWHLVWVCRELKRALRRDGTFWLNLGDSFMDEDEAESNLKDKDLAFMPARAAIALVDDGWHLRREIIWAKGCSLGPYSGRSLPEPTKNRPSSSHEYVFLLTRDYPYFYDIDACREPFEAATVARLTEPGFWDQTGGDREAVIQAATEAHHRSMRRSLENVARNWGINPKKPYRGQALKDYEGHGAQVAGDVKRRAGARIKTLMDERLGRQRLPPEPGEPGAFHPLGRNLRSVWLINPEQTDGLHPAVMPSRLVETCLKLSTSEVGACADCGAPWERIVEVVRPDGWEDQGPQTPREIMHREDAKEMYGENSNQKSRTVADIYGRALRSDRRTVGWQPTCECHGVFAQMLVPRDLKADPPRKRNRNYYEYWPETPIDRHPITPCIVLDPFAGSGTVMRVAGRLRRGSVGIEISPAWLAEAKEALGIDLPTLSQFEGGEAPASPVPPTS